MPTSKFSFCIMNPPFGEQGVAGVFGNELDMCFTYKCANLANIIISIMPEKIDSNLKYARSLYNDKHLKSINLYNANDTFGLHSYSYSHIGIYEIINDKSFDTIHITCQDKNIDENISNDLISRKNFHIIFVKGKELVNFANRLKPLYDELKESYGTMCDDNDQFIYEENKPKGGKIKKPKQIKLERVKKYLKTGKYKYCFFKGSFNHDYDAIQIFDGDISIFNGQICWLTKKENIFNNMIYWLESPLADFWRKYYIGTGGPANCYCYSVIPALNFDQPENKFRKYVDRLNNFNEQEIEILKNYNIHNAEKL